MIQKTLGSRQAFSTISNPKNSWWPPFLVQKTHGYNQTFLSIFYPKNA
jgi:hypothetical protein